MAIFNELQAGRLNRGLQKLTGIKGRASVRQLGTEILPVFSMPLGVEFRYLESWNKFFLTFNVAAVAANTSGVRFRNPSGSNVIAVVEKLNFDNASAAGLSINLILGQGGDLGTLNGGTRMDARVTPGFGTGASIITSQQNTSPGLPALTNSAALGFVNLGLTSSQVDVVITENQEICVLPGDLLQFAPSAVNQACTGEIWWRERLLEEAERF
jgi:hypothetical protein